MESQCCLLPFGEGPRERPEKPASLASRVSSNADWMLNFVVIAVRWNFTVRSWTPRSWSINLLSHPCTTLLGAEALRTRYAALASDSVQGN